jgi:hypothetical protein
VNVFVGIRLVRPVLYALSAAVILSVESCTRKHQSITHQNITIQLSVKKGTEKHYQERHITSPPECSRDSLEHKDP